MTCQYSIIIDKTFKRLLSALFTMEGTSIEELHTGVMPKRKKVMSSCP